MSAQGWGLTAPSAPDAADASIGETGGAFGASELREALLVDGNDQISDSKKPKIPEGWAQATPYDYEALGNKGNHDWDGNAKVYEWDGEEGDVGPEHPALEIELFGEPGNRVKQGIDFSKIASIQLYQEGPARVDPTPGADFKNTGLHPVMVKNIELAGYGAPTPIQRYCLPAIHLGYDVIAIAQTGSGKTAAYLVPILNKLMGKAKKLCADRPNPATYNPETDPLIRAEPLVVILCPTRELATQTFNEARKFCYRTMLRPCVVYGGGSFRAQEEQLRKGCDVLIGTPGRLAHMIDRPQILTLRRVRYMVIDEADEMLQDDWKNDLDKIMSGGEQEEGNINYMLFSATFPKGARDLAKTHLAETHVRLRVGRAGSSHENIKQSIIYVDPAMKKKSLFDLISSLPPTRTIVFVNSQRTADELDDFLYNIGLPCTSMHAGRTQMEREAAMRAFRGGKCPILVTTGVSARGIDVRFVHHVINFDIPSIENGGIEEYTHRVGRTGRIGHRGLATSFYNDRDEPMASVLTRTLMETKQEVPDFLQSYIPEGATADNLKFEADSDFEEDEPAGINGGDDTAGGDAWGTENADNGKNGDGGDAWGPEASKPTAPEEEASSGW